MDSTKNQANIEAFFALLRGGLWEKEVRLSSFADIDFNDVLQIAEEQSVVGLVAAGIEHVVDLKAPQDVVLQFVGEALQMEERNVAMNKFINSLFGELQMNGVKPLLVKGQGIAQCYERPFWRSSGDIDVLLTHKEYEIAKNVIQPFTLPEIKENKDTLEYCAEVKSWTVELHGTLHTRLTKKIDVCLDHLQQDCCERGETRIWQNGGQDVYLPSVDSDVIFVFTHIIKHFFHGGIGLRQICDWCRLLYIHKEVINVPLLEERLNAMGLLSIWRSFGEMAVYYLGMPAEAMPCYQLSDKYKKKGNRILDFIFHVGNFGHNRDLSYKSESSFIYKSAKSLWLNTRDYYRLFLIYPVWALREWWRMLVLGSKASLKSKL